MPFNGHVDLPNANKNFEHDGRHYELTVRPVHYLWLFIHQSIDEEIACQLAPGSRSQPPTRRRVRRKHVGTSPDLARSPIRLQ